MLVANFRVVNTVSALDLLRRCSPSDLSPVRRGRAGTSLK
jgi:hypothetical protein